MPRGLRRFTLLSSDTFAVVTIANSLWDRPAARDLFLKAQKEARQQLDFIVWGYVVMLEHFSSPDQ